ncbi:MULTISPECIES: hypothetical protein [Streptococcus]|uniref:hypothetical protein n=1 Tax=Streptococcus TaxID=1301 RepID=UPI001C8D9845|nr:MULTISPECIES: hypothetical protein [Streptococcus]MBY0719089.1 hypothetical protein [Streptococcus sp. 2018110]MCO8234582.1 hypothetical protein [Streptococcus suis]HEM3552414.1 hypothetical protein [Streptococcus suis]
MIYIDTEPYRKKKNYFGNRTTVEELYFKRILARYNDPLNLAELKSFIEQYIPKCINSSWDGKTFFRHLILLPPEELAKFAIKNTCKTPEQSKAIDDLKKVYTDYNILSKSIVFGKSEININQFLVRELGVTVCPYCNRNYINNRGDRFAAQMDHFYSKDEFPWLAVSLYNLIPSCGYCNHIKGTKALNVHPFIKKDVEETNLAFQYRYKSIDDIEVVISPNKDKNQDIEAIKEKLQKLRDIETLNLKEAYEIHGIDIQNMLEREVRYSESYRDELRDMLKIDTVVQYYDFYLSLTDDEIDRMIYGDVIFEEDIKNVSLGKFRKDIYQEIKKFRDY